MPTCTSRAVSAVVHKGVRHEQLNQTYLIAGLLVESDQRLVGRHLSADNAAPDITIRAGDVPVDLTDCIEAGPNWQRADDVFLLTIPGLVRMLITGGREIVYAAAATVEQSETALFVGGTGLGIALHQRELIVLHASAVSIGGKAQLFCGASGAGKSTLAAALTQRGYALISDDICVIEFRDGGAFVRSDGRQTRLWDRALEGLDLVDRKGEPIRPTVAKYHVATAAAVEGPVPIGSIFALRDDRSPGACTIKPTDRARAAAMLMANAYRPALVTRMGQGRLYLEAAAALALETGVYTLDRRMGFGRIADTIDALERHVADAQSDMA